MRAMLTWAHATLGLAAVLIALPSLPSARAQTPPAKTSPPATLQLKTFTIKDDPNFTGMEVTHGLIPADWTLKGGVVWNLSDARPMQFRIHISDPNDIAAIDIYPNHFFYWSRQPFPGQNAPDFKYMGAIVEQPPTDQFSALAQVVIRRDRPDLANAKVVKQEKQPDVAKAAYATLGQNPNYVMGAAAGRVTFEYQLKGQTVQEEFFITYEQETNQRLDFMDWQVVNTSSIRAPKGSLAQLEAIGQTVSRSCRPNLAFYTKVSNFVIAREQLTTQRLNDEQHIRDALAKARSDANDQEKQAFNQHMQDLDKQADSQADVQREVSPWKDPDGTTVKLPTQYGHAWSGADGRIIMNNDPLYNPNSDPSLTPTNWTPMEQAGN